VEVNQKVKYSLTLVVYNFILIIVYILQEICFSLKLNKNLKKMTLVTRVLS